MLSFIRTFVRPSFLPLLVIALLIGSIAAAPAAPAQPSPPHAAATQNTGEVQVNWNPAAGAQFYTVGWINRSDYLEMQSAGRDWLDAFHYATIPASYTAHIIKGLEAGANYYTIVGAQTSRFGGQEPTWSGWSNQVTTAGQHGADFCPVTGLPLPPVGYLSVGDTAQESDGSTFTLDRVTRTPSVVLGGTSYIPNTGFQFVKVCSTYYNNFSEALWVDVGYNYILTTDAGVGFPVSDDNSTSWLETGLIPTGATRSACDVWEIPVRAATVIIAVNTYGGTPALFKVDLP